MKKSLGAKTFVFPTPVCVVETGYVDIGKVKPILFDPVINTYHGGGRLLGGAFSIEKEIRGG